MTAIARRDFLGLAPSLTGLALLPGLFDAVPSHTQERADTLSSEFPRQSSAMVSRIVGLAHRDLDGVKAMLAERRSLANAAWDWGFGDWETPLGAAAHTGRAAIAELLLEHGATPTIFSAICLGQVDVVRAMLETHPRTRSILGPHGITLLAHARAGGERSAAVLSYLKEFPETDRPIANQALPAAVRDRLVGRYPFGVSADAYLEVGVRGEFLTLTRAGSSTLNLRYQGNLRFFPSGTTDTTVTFEIDSADVTMEIRDPSPVVRVKRQR